MITSHFSNNGVGIDIEQDGDTLILEDHRDHPSHTIFLNKDQAKNLIEYLKTFVDNQEQVGR